jgi:hypothetical protein
VTPAEHYREAERLTTLALDTFDNPEGGYDDSDADPSVEELHTRLAVRTEARHDARLYLHAAQVHAMLAAIPAEAVTAGDWADGDEVVVTITDVHVDGIGDHTTWLACAGLAEGIELPWVDDDGKPLPNVHIRKAVS